jgi:plasmid stabilization system protein ParE
MPQVIYTPNALRDLEKLRTFLKGRGRDVAQRAVSVIKKEIEKAKNNPERFRPATEIPYYREIVIDFGASGYIARFRYEKGGDIYIVRIKHQLEDELEPPLA